MSTPVPTLSNAPLEHPALDYAFLRQEGIRHLESLAGHLWTDFNAHDPGITLLEQLCYAITDLAYRASHEVPDLLASSGGDPYQSLYSASTILTSHPVTLLDLRKAVIDVEGVKNAWIEELHESSPPLHLHEARGELRFQPDPPYTRPVLLKGRVRVLIETSDLEDRHPGEVRRDVARRLHACRPLCTDFDDIQVLAPQPVEVFAEVEIGPVDDAERVVLDIYQALLEYVSPSIAFKTLGELLAEGRRSDEIFDGPALRNGFLDSEALERRHRKDALYTSDLIREIMGIPGVRAVRGISVSTENTWDPWSVRLDPNRAPRLDLHASRIKLVKGGLTARLDTARIIETLAERRGKAAPREHLSPGERDFSVPAGRDRNVARYRSIQHQLPAIYGVGAAGLPGPVTPRRQAQARQLQAYLLFFDQLLASYFAQLAHAGSLLSFYGEDARTYFTQMVDEPGLDLSAVRRLDAKAHRARLSELAEDREASGSLSNRKNRFYDHLMARFAEQFTDYSLVLFGAEGREGLPAGDRLMPDKRAFLQRYPRLSSARGTGRDALSLGGEGGVAGLQERIERKLGLTDEERFLLVEHLLLAPIPADNIPPGPLEYRQIPILSDCLPRDPYSLQLSFVLPLWRGRAPRDPQFRGLVEQTLREETPAHLVPYIHWVGESEWTSLERAHGEWLTAYRDHQAEKLGLQPMNDPRSFRVRDARDRLIDLLGLGKTYPLRDLPVPDEGLTVPFNQSARVSIEASQRDVVYELRGEGDTPLASAQGNGGTLYLQTPPMREDTTYNILARRIATGQEVYLLQQVTVKVGLDVALRARVLDAAPLDPSIGHPGDADARIVAWGTHVRVQVDHSQEGVDYHLVRFAGGEERRLSPDVRGDQGDIVLLAEAISEDVDLRIRATKVFDPSENRPPETGLLNAVLPLKVRARPGLPMVVEPSPILDFGWNATVRIDNTQASTRYSVYVRAVADSDFVFTAGGSELLGVDVEGAPRVHVRSPPVREVWEDLAGFERVGTPAPGNGGLLRLPVNGLKQDSVILVRAQKEHQARVNIPSSVQLEQAALLLVRPNPRPELRLGVELDGALEVAGGQPGVFYYVRRETTGEALGLPAYFHKTDERNAALNKGLEQLRIEVDFVLSRGTVRPATSAELASTPPLEPLLSTGPLEAGTTLYFRAVKAQTRVAIDLTQTARIAPFPAIRAEPVPQGSPARIVVLASVVGDRYQLTQAGQPVGPALDGNGEDLAFTTGPLQAATEFQVRVTRSGDTGIPVERRVRVSVGVG
ncbi:MAG TPA: hypothetical protein VE153_09675 [Myxococcus sp.]|nr:hypothetical protein [Myxococcus sp.]